MADLIKEFLIGIGIAIDDAQIRKYQKTLDGAEKDIRKLDEAERKAEKEEAARLKRRGEAQAQFSRSIVAQGVLIANALEAAAKAIVKATAEIAHGFEEIYYSSQRTNTSVANLRSMSYAVGQLGGSTQKALGSIEAVARNFRDNPGFEAMAKSLGVATRQNGKLRETTDILEDLGGVFGKQEYYIARQYANALGIDEDTFRLLRDQPAALKKYREEYERTAKRFGLDTGKASEAGKQFMQSLRSLSNVATIAAEKFYSDLAPALTRIVDRFSAWIAAHPEQINAILEAGVMIVTAFANVAVKLGESLEPVVKQFGDWAKAVTGKDGAMESMETFATFIAGAWLAKVLAGFAGAGAGFTALLLRLGIPVAIGAAAAGHGFQTPEQYKQRLETDPEAKRFDEERRQQGGSAKRWWKRNMPTWLGGDPDASRNEGTGIARRAKRAAEADRTSYNFTGENAEVTRKAAAELGTTPEALAAVISYETGGTFSPKKWGGKGGNYMGLIQFGPKERRMYGANENQTYAEQMGAVVRYLKSRGFKPGMDLRDLYSTINAGRPGLYHRNDGNGTVQSHSEKIAREHMGRARRFLSSGSTSVPTPPAIDYGKVAESMKGYDFSQSKPGTVPLGASSNDNSTYSPTFNGGDTHVSITGSGNSQRDAAEFERAANSVNRMSLRNAQSAMR